MPKNKLKRITNAEHRGIDSKYMKTKKQIETEIVEGFKKLKKKREDAKKGLTKE